MWGDTWDDTWDDAWDDATRGRTRGATRRVGERVGRRDTWDDARGEGDTTGEGRRVAKATRWAMYMRQKGMVSK